jgi:serine/threonine protein kinase
MAGSGDPSLLDRLTFLHAVRHPTLVPVLGFRLPEGRNPGPAVMTEFMPHGSLAQMLESEWRKEKPRGWNATAKSKCVYGIALAMFNMHNSYVPHGNLKPENVLLCEDFEPHVCDYGLPRSYGSEFLNKMKKGTALCIAPELVKLKPNQNEWLPEADVFSFGSTLYRMFTDNEVLAGDGQLSMTLEDGRWVCVPGKYASFDARDFTKGIMAGDRLARVSAISDYYWELISACWNPDPQARPTFMEIIEELGAHRYWLKGARKASMIEYESRTLQGLEKEEEESDE